MAYLSVQAAPDTLVLLAGDLNSASPHDPERDGFDLLPAHHRIRYVADDLKSVDRGVLAQLEAADWKAIMLTVPSAGFIGTEFAATRCDYVMATAALAAGAKRYGVVRTPETHSASDHYPIIAIFEVSA